VIQALWNIKSKIQVIIAITKIYLNIFSNDQLCVDFPQVYIYAIHNLCIGIQAIFTIEEVTIFVKHLTMGSFVFVIT